MKKVKIVNLKKGDQIIEDNHIGETFLMNVLDLIVGEEMTEINIEKYKGKSFKRNMFNEEEVMVK